MKLSVSDWK